MPTMIISPSGQSTAEAFHGTKLGTFTGSVMVNPVLNIPEQTMSINDVNFQPCARTNWHYHEGGQLLQVKAGSGWICDKGGEPKRIAAGDIVWCPPGTIHWHGAEEGTFMVHQATSFGRVEWYGAVGEEEYRKGMGVGRSEVG